MKNENKEGTSKEHLRREGNEWREMNNLKGHFGDHEKEEKRRENNEKVTK